MDHSQPIPSPPHQRTYFTCPRSVAIFQIRHTLGIQQRTHQRRRRMEGSIYHKSRPVRTKSHVLWPHKLPCYIPNYDERHIRRRTAQKLADNLHGRHPSPYHRRHHKPQRKVHKVLQKLRQHDLYLKPEKCQFEQKKVEFLGVILEKEMVQMDPTKTKGIADWKTPQNLKDVHSLCISARIGHTGKHRNLDDRGGVSIALIP